MMGVVQFGNNKIEADFRTATSALNIMLLAHDKKKLQDALVAFQYLKVFTNMAQGCAMGEDLFIKGGR